MSTPPAATPTAPQLEYDQIVSADVKIKKLCNSDDEYKITFVGNVSKVLLYQVWSPTSPALNNDRKVFELKAKDWVKVTFPKSPLAFSFTPTCVMEFSDGECTVHNKGKQCRHRHVFVINKGKVNKNGQVVLYVSSEDIDKNNTNKVIKKNKKIPQGKFHNARFDIDFSICGLCVLPGFSPCYNGGATSAGCRQCISTCTTSMCEWCASSSGPCNSSDTSINCQLCTSTCP
jgi:hypothetical protein